jgi:HEPN domain-containing protein
MSKKNELIFKWILFAENDLKVAKILFEENNFQFYQIIMFHSQQAVEKMIKAFLINHDIEFKKIHNLNKLLSMIEHIEGFDVGAYDYIDIFNKFSVEVRYPEMEEIPTKEDCIIAIEMTNKIFDIFKPQI